MCMYVKILIIILLLNPLQYFVSLWNRFHLKCSEPSVEEVDITVSVGVSSDLEEREALQDMERTPLQ